MQDYIAGAAPKTPKFVKSRSSTPADCDPYINSTSEEWTSGSLLTPFVADEDALNTNSPDGLDRTPLSPGMHYSNSAPCMLHISRRPPSLLSVNVDRYATEQGELSRVSSHSGRTASPSSCVGLRSLEKPLLQYRESWLPAVEPMDGGNTPVVWNDTQTLDSSHIRNGANVLSPQRWMDRVVQKKYRKFTVLEVSDGKSRRHELQTPELLRAVHCYNKSNLLEDTAAGALKLRDLRQVVSPLGIDRPSIEARRNCILVNLLSVRCIIQHNKVFLIQPVCGEFRPGVFINQVPLEDDNTLEFAGAMSPVSDSVYRENMMLMEKMLQLTELRSAGPFEFAALEAILVEVCQRLSNELLRVKKAADKLLHFMSVEPSSSKKLREVTDVRRSLVSDGTLYRTCY
eukprot:GHVQ01033115.1.p1 GENE.GHVQ01033115.1~~GHVQ01033115.1.p1  ORF type:complete len:400 (+),score=52.49 GHVQ01033115.1:570-1769(+)